MTAGQTSAFTGAASVSPEDLYLVIASMIAVIAFAWAAWSAMAQLRLWHANESNEFDLPWMILRTVVVLMIVLFIIE